MNKIVKKVLNFFKKAEQFTGSRRMTAVTVDAETRALFANPPMSSFGNMPAGYSSFE